VLDAQGAKLPRPLVTGDDYAVMAGVPAAIAFAEQINKVETFRPEDSFSDAVKGLQGQQRWVPG
jgi:hypothetical protein